MKKSKIYRSGLCLFLLAAFFVLSVSTMAYAEYEIAISGVTSDVPTDGTTIVKWNQDVTIEWEKPAISGSDLLNGFVYKWNTTRTKLTDLTEENADGTVLSTLNPPYVTKAASFFAADDSDVIRYLHIRTWFYDSSASAVTYSDDVVIGGINIDNVAPAGTVRIVNSEGSDINSTYSTNLNLRLSASKAPVKVYINETASRDTAISSSYASEITYTLNSTAPGAKTIYVWFEDGAGNITSAAATDTVTILSSEASISPFDGTFDIALEDKVFIVDGSTSNYDWEIFEETPNTTGDDVADFIGIYEDTNEGATVSLLNLGSFKLRATPSAGGTAIESGVITVTGVACTPGDVNDDGSITIEDVQLSFTFFLGGESTAKQFCAANVRYDGDDDLSVNITDVQGVFTLFLGGTL